MTDAAAQPFEDAKSFTYHQEWTGSLFNVIRFLVKVMCIDSHDEQKQAWKSLWKHDFPKRATEVFSDMSFASYSNAQDLAAQLNRKDKQLEVQKARDYTTRFRQQYDRAGELAVHGQ
jgi:hypothetical protein